MWAPVRLRKRAQMWPQVQLSLTSWRSNGDSRSPHRSLAGCLWQTSKAFANKSAFYQCAHVQPWQRFLWNIGKGNPVGDTDNMCILKETQMPCSQGHAWGFVILQWEYHIVWAIATFPIIITTTYPPYLKVWDHFPGSDSDRDKKKNSSSVKVF